jgi:Uma2 family endonuclease
MTADEFLRLHGEDDENRWELIEGEVCERALNGYSHDRVKNNLKRLFDQAGVARHGFECWIEHSFLVAGVSAITPDAAIIRTERLTNRRGNSPTNGAPEIPIEVVISDQPWVLQQKISAYLKDGACAVCCAYPNLKRVTVYTAHEWRELTEQDHLEFPALLPGLSIPVSAIFDGI